MRAVQEKKEVRNAGLSGYQAGCNSCLDVNFTSRPSERRAVMNKSSLLEHVKNLQREVNSLMDIVIAMEDTEPQLTHFLLLFRW